MSQASFKAMATENSQKPTCSAVRTLPYASHPETTSTTPTKNQDCHAAPAQPRAPNQPPVPTVCATIDNSSRLPQASHEQPCQTQVLPATAAPVCCVSQHACGMPQQQAIQPQEAPQQQSSSLEFGIAMTQSLPDAPPLFVPLRPFRSNGLPNSIIITCMAPHSKMAQPRMASGCWVDAWLAHVMRQSAVMLVALTSAVHCWHHHLRSLLPAWPFPGHSEGELPAIFVEVSQGCCSRLPLPAVSYCLHLCSAPGDARLLS